jgi:hypothetical protein
MDVDDTKERVLAIHKEHAPDKVDGAHELLEKYRGEEGKLLKKNIKKK